jgi:nicotinate-nucleotide adenylyltransferase
VRLGVFGGTFDPPHVGHLLAAVDAIERLGLDRMVLVPAAQQPLKVGTVAAAPAQRLEMTRLLAGDDPRFEVDPIEIDRAGLSYSVETLEELSRSHDRAELYFVVGADALETFERWREPRRVMELARLVVLRRTADAVALPRLMQEAPGREPIVLASRRVDVSSTEVRSRVRAGLSIRGFVPDAVAAYVQAAGLYR